MVCYLLFQYPEYLLSVAVAVAVPARIHLVADLAEVNLRNHLKKKTLSAHSGLMNLPGLYLVLPWEHLV